MSDDEQLFVRVALDRYQNGWVGMRGAANLADLTIAELMAEANERNVCSNHDQTDVAAFR